MKLHTLPPQAIHSNLKQAGVDVDAAVISISSDINLLGQYEPQWLVANAKMLWVFDERRPTETLLTVTFEETSEFRTVAVVGSGLLQAKISGIWLDLLRFSNRQKYYFGRVAKRLDQLRQGNTVTIEEEDEHDPRRCRTCGLMLEFQGETCPRCLNRGAALSRVLQLMRPYWGSAGVMFLLLIIGIMIDLSMPQLTRILVDRILAPVDAPVNGAASTGSLITRLAEKLSYVEPVKALLVVVGALACFNILRALVNILNGRMASAVGTSITFDVRAKLVEHLEKLSLSYYDKQSTGSLVGRVAYDTEAVQGFMSQLTSGFLMQIIMVVLTGFAMFSVEPHLAMWALLPAPFVMFGATLYYRWIYPRYNRFWDRQSKQANMINGILSGIRVVKAFNQEEREFKRFQRSSSTLRDARRSLDLSAATYYPIFGLVFTAGGWIVWYVGGKDVLLHKVSPERGITLGTLLMFMGYMGMFYAPLQSLTNLTSWLTGFSTQMHRIFEVLDTPIAVPDARDPVSIEVMKGDIEFQNVVFGYSRQNPILKSVTFKIDSGQMIGVVGRSGSGKTTVINLISRFYDIDEGKILIDGHEIRKIRRQDVSRQVGVVLQEPFLFRGTLWQNLVYGRTDAAVPDVLAASRAGNSHDFIMRQLYAYDTWVGERGAGLSGGERQRLSIARALLCDPRILILDEATSSVDSESELAIQNALSELVKGRTSIIIAHRLSTLRNCDKIMVIEEGRLVEEGTHNQLMAIPEGKYAKLVKIQTSVSKTDSVDTIVAHEEQMKKQGITDKPVTDAPPEADPTTGLMPINHFRPRWLEPGFAKIHLGNRNALHVTILNERIYNGVFALRCMPIRYPSQFISLRWVNAENREQEIGLIRDLTQWPPDVQQLINESLLRRYFVHVITSVESIEQIQNFLNFKVNTDLGEMEFFMRWSSDTAQDYGEKGKVLLDVEENRYVIPDVSALPDADRELFERFIYW
ncbi:MAG: DUF1854 domain-containing protein [Planctomycetes bacterium]|nr:DUF1854 domain-containing protein [Planctomycetota bacterium]